MVLEDSTHNQIKIKYATIKSSIIYKKIMYVKFF